MASKVNSQFVESLLGMLAAQGMTVEDLSRFAEAVDGGVPASLQLLAGVSVRDMVKLGRQAMPEPSVRTYGPYWNFLADGWAIEPQHLERVVPIAATQGLELGRAPSSYEHVTFERYGKRRDGLQLFAGHGDLDLAALKSSHVRVAAKYVKTRALLTGELRAERRIERGLEPQRYHGKGAVENFIAATRCLFAAACEDDIVDADTSPAAGLKKPGRDLSERRPMSDRELEDTYIASVSGDDPELAGLMYEYHVTEGARQEEGLNLELGHLDLKRATFELDGKNDKRRTIPGPPSLIRRLDRFARSRGASAATDKVFLHVPARGQQIGEPISGRTYDHWGERVQRQLGWAAKGRWGSHWLRHHAAAVFEDVGGKAVKRTMLGHAPADTSDGYGLAPMWKLAGTIQEISGEPHPLARV